MSHGIVGEVSVVGLSNDKAHNVRLFTVAAEASAYRAGHRHSAGYRADPGMAEPAGSTTSVGKSTSTLSTLPDVPGALPLKHTATVFLETLEDTLGDMGLLTVAKGQPLAAAELIIDVPLGPMPTNMDPSSPQFLRLLQHRLEIETN